MNTFPVVLIKPSHYDDEGYVIQWFRSAIPSNTLATLNSLAMNCAQRKALGEDVELSIEAYDETNTVLPIRSIIQSIKTAGRGLVGIVGVQSNQFPRAVDLADRFLHADIPVVIGGFHVSGCLAMLPEVPPDIQAAMDKGITVVAGEAEEHLEEVLRDAYHCRLKPLYNFMDDLPNLEGIPSPFLPRKIVEHTLGRLSSFDAGRGCPFQCSFCTIINVQGRKSRWRSADDIEALIRANLKQGIRRFFITDDDFARNRNWEAILDRCIAMREKEKLPISFTIQVDTMCHKIPRFIEKCARAGCRNIFIGLESLNPEALVEAKKRQNKVSEYRKMVQMWKDHKCTTVAGYIIGFPTDTPESIQQDIETIKQELPVDLLQFTYLTPLPGSEDHQKLYQQGVWMDADLNKYDLIHVTTRHPKMSQEEWEQGYHMAWKQYYSLEHVETVLRRAAAKDQNLNKVMFLLLWSYGTSTIEGTHPEEGGIFRRRVRTMRRSGFPLEHPFIFYPRRLWEVVSTSVKWGILMWQFHRIKEKVKGDPLKREYRDLALTPVLEEDGTDLSELPVSPGPHSLLHIEKYKTASTTLAP
jgi:radical SAM superfamily enzyme YgiQ (UPF0313 family)